MALFFHRTIQPFNMPLAYFSQIQMVPRGSFPPSNSAVYLPRSTFPLQPFNYTLNVITDHKPLVSILNKPTANLSARMERWMLRKQPFDFLVEYQPGANNAADYLSKHPEQNGSCKPALVSDEFVRFVSCQATPSSLSATEIA